MNDRYLFRGKTKISERWVVGDLLQWSDGDMCICKNRNHFEKDKYAVIPETVGQYTGLKDKNGKKIFEGDIVELYDKNNDIKMKACVEFGNPNKEYNWGYQLVATGETIPNLDILLWVEMEDTGAFIEVIGNIHDNPDLLKGE